MMVADGDRHQGNDEEGYRGWFWNATTFIDREVRTVERAAICGGIASATDLSEE
jgi:hypothetical protein